MPNASNVYLMHLNGISARVDYENSILLETKAGSDSYTQDPELNVYNFGSNSSARLIFYNTWAQQHPIHLHGHDFWVLDEDYGTWNGTVTRPSNPQRRDTQLISPGSTENLSYLVIEWEQNNPGVWPIHCHMSSHASAGFLLNVLVRIYTHTLPCVDAT
jgi:FtsP/CotA-like multicopper oxidase with cupredoxin domain